VCFSTSTHRSSRCDIGPLWSKALPLWAALNSLVHPSAFDES
jgi:hypothetical protein